MSHPRRGIIDADKSSTEIDPATHAIEVRARYWLGLDLDYAESTQFGASEARIVLFDQTDDDGDRVDQVQVVIDRQMSSAQIADLIALTEGRVPDGTDRNHPLLARRLADVDGERLRAPVPYEALAEELRSAISSARDELAAKANAFGRALRWRTGARGSHQTLRRNGHVEWRVGESKWRRLPGGTSLRFLPAAYPVLDATAQSDIESLLTTGHDEPLGHALFREASDNATRNGRSSLVLCIVALEVGVKTFISRVAPVATWLALEAPTPPTFKIIRDYLPGLVAPSGRRLIRPSSPTLTLIREGVEARNGVSHRGSKAWPRDRLAVLLKTTRAFLYAADYVAGVEWAVENLSDSERDEWLGKPDQTRTHT